MKYWKQNGFTVSEPNCADEWMELIWQVGVDYDGYNTTDGLRSLVDELVAMSQKARDCLREGKIYPDPKDEMRFLHDNATMSHFASMDECQAYRNGVRDCIKILEENT